MTRRQLLANASSSELTDWMAYDAWLAEKEKDAKQNNNGRRSQPSPHGRI